MASDSPASSGIVTSHRLGHIFKSIFNYADYNSSLRTPDFTAEFPRKLSGLGGAPNQALHSSKLDDCLVSLARELKTYSDRLRPIFSPHSRCVPDHDILRPNSFSISDDASIFSSHTAKCELTLVQEIVVDSFEGPPSTHLPSSNRTISKSRDTAQDALRNLFLWDPLSRGQEYLRRNAGNLYSQTTQSINPGDSLELFENFSQLLILETTNDP